MAKIEPAAIAATPDDSPSMLSSRLSAFVMPTTHSTVIAASVTPGPNRSMPPRRPTRRGRRRPRPRADDWTETREVVEQADEREEHREAEHDEQLAPSRDRRPHERRDHDRERERGDDREPTEVRHGVGVALVPTREVEHVAAEREAQHQGGEQQRERRRHEEDCEVLPPAPGHDERQYR